MPGALNDREFNKFTEQDEVKVTDINQVLKKYSLADFDTDSTPQYLGSLAIDGSWYIKKIDATSMRYVKGDSGYTTAWTNRASQTYGYFDAVFG